MANIRVIAMAACAACVAGLTWSSWRLAERVGEFHRTSKREVYAFESRTAKQFKFAGKSVTFEDDRTDPQNQLLIVKYGDAEPLRLRVSVPGNPKLPDLLPHEDWLRVLRFGLMSGRTMAQFKADLGSAELPDRVAIVTRSMRPGADPSTWGAVWIKDWYFDFYELLPQGGFKHEKLRYPTNRVGEPAKEGELRENSWEFQAALQLMPQSARERIAGKTTNDAMSHLGWTLPLATVFGTGAVAALCVAAVQRSGRGSGAGR